MNEYDSSVYTVTVNVDENMDTFITFIKNGTNVDNSSEGVDEVEYYHLQSLLGLMISLECHHGGRKLWKTKSRQCYSGE